MKTLSVLLVALVLSLGIVSAVDADEEFDEGEKFAQENDVTDIAYDENDPNNALADNDSDSFNRGVRAYAEEQI